MKALLNLIFPVRDNTKIVDIDLYKIFIVPLDHPDFDKLAVLRLGNGKLIHCVSDTGEWLLVECDSLTPSPSGVLRGKDVDQLTHILNLDTFLEDVYRSSATWRVINDKERQVLLDNIRT